MVNCPLCGFEFDPNDTLCHHGCPLKSACALLRCPSCEYEFPREAKAVSLLRRLLKRRPRRQPAAQGTGMTPLTVRDLGPGDRARVLCLAGDDENRHNRLVVFGLTPGASVELLQRSPAYVLRVGETELALEAGIAGEIVVEAVTA